MRSKQPAQGTFDRHHAVVIGGSMAGLLAARVLSDHFAQVTIIERDKLTGDAEPRKGVPQGRHVHGLLARGAVIMREYFPELFPKLAQDGAIPVGTEGVRWNQLGVWMTPVRSPVKALFQSRPFLERHVRDQLAARDNVHIMDACEVSQLCAHNDRITGVVLRYRTGEQHEEALSADLVVDTSGRGSRAPQWLNSLGYGKVQETSVKIDIGYATRIYRCPALLPADWKGLNIYGRPPDDKRGGVIFPIEGGYWMVTLIGSLRDHPPDDEAGFLEFARSLTQPDLYEAIKDAEPVTPVAVYKYSANRWRHYERMKRLPRGFIIMGDAACSFNPVYGQGMSVAAIEAQTLDRCLREQKMFAGNNGVVGFTQRFQQAIARDIKTPWLLSTGEDLRYPGAGGEEIAQHTPAQQVHAPRYRTDRIRSTCDGNLVAGPEPAQTLVNTVPTAHHPGRASPGTGHIQATAYRNSASKRDKRASLQQLRAAAQQSVSREMRTCWAGRREGASWSDRVNSESEYQAKQVMLQERKNV